MQDRRIYHVMPRGESNWQVRNENADGIITVHEIREKAVAAGKELAMNNEPSRLVIHKADGAVKVAYTYG